MAPARAASATPKSTDTTATDQDAPAPNEAPEVAATAEETEQAKEPTPYEYTWGDPTQYPHIPLTAYPARPAQPEERSEDGTVIRPAVNARPATVFAFVEPPDARWRPTDLPANQAPDNQPPLTAKGA
jgi:hypothetical protein